MRQPDLEVALTRYQELLDGLQTTAGIQLPSSGYGKLIHRQYSIEFDCNQSAAEVIEKISQDLNPYCHEAMATFVKEIGTADRMEIGDDYLIRISGPWQGPVRVIDKGATSFALATRDGHLEAGFIEFKVEDGDEYQRRFTIQSWATSGKFLVWVTYTIFRVTKMAQTAIWTEFCTRVAKRFGVNSKSDSKSDSKNNTKIDSKGDVQISDSAFPLPKPTSSGSGSGSGSKFDKRSANHLAELHRRGFNYEVESYSPDDPSWRHDSYVTTVGTESPGPPEDGGLFMTAKQIVSEYRFPDPRRISGQFDPDADLDGRNMILNAQFLGIRVQFAVRVVDVIDREIQHDGEPCHEWGYAYRTLDGHWEVGQITFLLRKNLESGEVLFLINAYSRTGHIPNPIYRLGFWLMGRKVQTDFAKQCLKRLVKLTHEEMNTKV